MGLNSHVASNVRAKKKKKKKSAGTAKFARESPRCNSFTKLFWLRRTQACCWSGKSTDYTSLSCFFFCLHTRLDDCTTLKMHELFPGPPNLLLHHRGLGLRETWLSLKKSKMHARSNTLAWRLRIVRSS